MKHFTRKLLSLAVTLAMTVTACCTVMAAPEDLTEGMVGNAEERVDELEFLAAGVSGDMHLGE